MDQNLKKNCFILFCDRNGQKLKVEENRKFDKIENQKKAKIKNRKIFGQKWPNLQNGQKLDKNGQKLKIGQNWSLDRKSDKIEHWTEMDKN